MHSAIKATAAALALVAMAGCSSQASSTGASGAAGSAASVATAVASAAPSVVASAEAGPSGLPTATPDASTVKAVEDRALANPKDPAAQLDLGDVYFITKQYDKAVEAYQQVVTITPDDSDAWTALGAAAYNAGDAEAARDALLKAITLNPSNQEALYDIAFAYLSLNPPNTLDATSALQKAIEIDPNSDIGKAAQQTLDSMSASAPPG